jgi:acyl-CoA reductase-like NAD-dependent aldehyde dehydrogenase
MKVGNARVVLNAQPSMPLTQWDQLGQTLLVMSFRTTPELLTLLGNLIQLTELSLWVEHQSTAWQVIDGIQIPRVWLNGIPAHLPGADQLVPVQDGAVETLPAGDDKTNSGVYSALDALRNAQRAWALQGNRSHALVKLLLQLSSAADASAIVQLIRFVQSNGGKGRVQTSTKDALTFQLTDPLGVVAVLAAADASADSVIKVVTVALLSGNTVALSFDSAHNAAVQSILK